MPQDIRNKGVTRNYNTKPSEKANGPLKKYYKHTNFKKVASQVSSNFLAVIKNIIIIPINTMRFQILRVSEMDLVSTMIRSDITLFDDAIESRDSAADDRDDPILANADSESDSDVNEGTRITHGSVQRDITFRDLEFNNFEDTAFLNFRVRLADALAIRLEVEHVYLRMDDVVSKSIYNIQDYADFILLITDYSLSVSQS